MSVCDRKTPLASLPSRFPDPRSGLDRGVGAAGLLDPAFLPELAEDPAEVVRLDLHLLRDLGGRDAGVLLDQADRLVGAGPAAAATPAGRRARARARSGLRRTPGA